MTHTLIALGLMTAIAFFVALGLFFFRRKGWDMQI